MPYCDLYYSKSLLGHFTLIVYDKVDLIVHRIHFVDRDAETAHGGKIAWVKHKIAQLTGFATGKILSDYKSSPKEYAERVNYKANGRERLQQYVITVPQMDRMLNWVHELLKKQDAGHSGNYGYVVYSNNIDNCGSFAIKCLEQADVRISLNYIKQWMQLPSFIRNDMNRKF